MICCVIPTYRAAGTICAVVRDVLQYVDLVIVVDDACPEHSSNVVLGEFAAERAVVVLRRDANGGVGQATKTGIAKALELGANVIVKVDADGQMDPAYIPDIVDTLRNNPGLAYVKGNRFFSADAIKKMPAIRLIGNAVLSLMVKFSSGYWNILDPTNGYCAFDADALGQLEWESFADRYFFEISVLCTLGLHRAPIAELEMVTIYGAERSSLSITKTLWEFPRRLAGRFLHRILLQYFLFDVNLGTLYLLFGFGLSAAGLAFGTYEWIETISTHIARTTGTIMLAVLPALMGFQLLLNALMYDVQFGAKSVRAFSSKSTSSVKLTSQDALL